MYLFIQDLENHIAIAPLKRNLPLTDADLASLEELLFNAKAVESWERFEEVFGADDADGIVSIVRS